MPKDLTVLNAANLCPSSGPVLETMYRLMKDMDQDPSQANRDALVLGSMLAVQGALTPATFARQRSGSAFTIRRGSSW